MKFVDKWFLKKIKKGLYHYRATGKWQGLRLHLRVEEDGKGILMVNASRVLFLNKTATEHVYLFMKGHSEEEAVQKIKKRYKVDAKTALNDYRDVLFIVNTFAKTSDVCPVSYLGVKKIEPFQRKISSPYRMDLALTYRCNNRCIHCYTGGPRETPELSTKEWYRVIDKLFTIGIPHIVFTGGEPTLRNDLSRLIRYAEERGLISGLVTNGRKLKDKKYLEELLKAGIDHIQITLESHDESVHDKITGTEGSWRETLKGLKNAISSPVYTITNTTLNQYNYSDILKTVQFLNSLGLKDFALNSVIYSGKAPDVAKDFAIEETKLVALLTKIRNYALTLGMEFVWYTPTRYCVFNPLELELGIKNCSACRINMCIEPTGDVIPCQSYFKPLGNILKNEWNSIWNNPLCQKIRNRNYAPNECKSCPQLYLCGAGCPLNLDESVCNHKDPTYKICGTNYS
ncbi:MAG: radical SAM protein [Candidatus Bathyarchaeota archaeon]|nr:MAG: radical SAM protein [Candidatus Bathyarchaeota archaeon]